MKTNEIKDLLIQSISRVISELIPGGSFQSGRYVAGSIHGGEGKSFSMITAGPNIGTWKDFSTDQHGDILKLFYYRNGETYPGMIAAATEFLGTKQTSYNAMELNKNRATYSKPAQTWVDLDPDSKVFKYLTIDRKIPAEVLEKFEVKQTKDQTAYVFLFRSPNAKKICLSKTTKIKRDENGKKVTFTSKDGMWCLFGMHPTHTYETDYIIITEGELDALSYEAEGLRAASIPGGVENTKWIDNSYAYWNKFDTVYLSFDMDEAGASAVDHVLGRIGIGKCKIIKLPKKDANSCLIEGIKLKQYVDSAKGVEPSKLVSCGQLSSKMWDALSAGRRELQGIPFMGWDCNDEINFKIRPKELTIYTGYPGHGKSAMLYQLVSYLIGCHDHKIAIASLEENPETIANLILFSLLNKVIDDDSRESRDAFDRGMEILSNKLFLYHHIGQAPLAEIVEFSEYCVRRHGCQHVVIDSVAKTDLDIEDNKQANQFAETITRSMNETGAHYHLVAHSRKGDSGDIRRIPGQDDIKGSVQFSITAFNVVTVWKNELKIDLIKSGQTETKEGKPLISEWGDGKIRICKQRVGGQTGEYKTFYNANNYRFRRDYDKYDYPYMNSHNPF